MPNAVAGARHAERGPGDDRQSAFKYLKKMDFINDGKRGRKSDEPAGNFITARDIEFRGGLILC